MNPQIKVRFEDRYLAEKISALPLLVNPNRSEFDSPPMMISP